MVKTGLLAGEPLWELPLPEQVRRCAAFKTAVCLRDPHDRGERAQLNLGHTFAHALEAAAGFELPHGRAVALGLLAALRLSGLDTAAGRAGPPAEPVRVDRELAWAALARDKKVVGGVPRLVLLEAPGRPLLGVELPRGRGAGRPRRADRRIEFRACASPSSNGVNLDVLDRRDAVPLRRAHPVRPREPHLRAGRRSSSARPGAGRRTTRAVHRLVPRRARLGRRRHPEPRRVVALQLRDPRRGRALQGPGRRGAPLQDRGARGVAAGFRDRRPGHETGLRRGARGLPRRRSSSWRGSAHEPGSSVSPRCSKSRCSSRAASTCAT